MLEVKRIRQQNYLKVHESHVYSFAVIAAQRPFFMETDNRSG